MGAVFGCVNPYNKFRQVKEVPYAILTYLMQNNENLFKLLKYISPNVNPYVQPDLSFSEKVAMIATNSYDTNESVSKNVLFITELREAFSTNVAQLRVEVADIVPINSYQAYINIDFQIIVPIVNDVMNSTGITGERRTDSIFLELAETLNGVEIPNSGLNSPIFMNKEAPDGAGRKNGAFRDRANTDYTSRWVSMSALI